jgi:exopolysaccharide biosynthesis polyprenyl glycosylphosphotransferase
MTMRANVAQATKSLPVTANKRWLKHAGLLAALIVVDLVMVLVGFRLAYALRFESGITWFFQHEISRVDFYEQIVFILAPIWILVFATFGLYDVKNLFSGTREYTRVFNAATTGILLIILCTFFLPDLIIARGWVIFAWFFVTVGVSAGRFGFRRVVHHIRKHGHFISNVMIIGVNDEGQAIAQQLVGNHKAGVNIVGFVDDNVTSEVDPQTGLAVLGSIDAITTIAQKYNVQEVIITSTALPRPQLFSLMQSLQVADISVKLSSGMYELLTTGVEVQEVGNVPLLSVNKIRLTGSDVIMKRMLDIVGSGVALIVFAPVMLLIGLAIKLDSPGPIIYRRRVVGVGGKQFNAFKFRTMAIDADNILAQNAALQKQFQKNFKLKDDPRVTRIGRFLRRTSLDELTQLFNVLFGQMSLVGPRMITDQELSYYGKWSMNLSTVKPGITGLWQVSGRSDVSYSERVRLDMQYIRNYTIWMDLYLLWQTIPAVLKSRGAY